jgi:hypothetical protein
VARATAFYKQMKICEHGNLVHDESCTTVDSGNRKYKTLWVRHRREGRKGITPKTHIEHPKSADHHCDRIVILEKLLIFETGTIV